MKKTHTILSTSLFLLSTSMPVLAEETEKASVTPTWEASAELGFVKTEGNSDTDTLNARVSASTSYTKWKHSLDLDMLNSSSNSVRSAEKYLAVGQSDRKISDRSYLLGVATWEKDRFSGFNYQTSIALGYGYKAIKNDSLELDLEVAPGYRVNELNSGEQEKDTIVRLAEILSWKVSKTATLDQRFSSEVGDSNTTTRFGIFLTSQIANELSMKVGYSVKHNSDVPVGSEKTDRETSVTLVYKI